MHNVITIGHLFKKDIEKFYEHIAYRKKEGDAYKKYSYGEVEQIIDNLRAGIASLGYSKKSKIAIVGPNSPEWVMSYLTLASSGIPAVPIDNLMSIVEIRHIISDSKTSAIFSAPNHQDDIVDYFEEKEFPKCLKHIILFNKNGKVNQKRILSFDYLQKLGEKYKKSHTLVLEKNPDALASIIYTSGTTGQSKAVLLSHRNFVTDVSACFKEFEFTSEDVFLSLLPIHHVFEFTGTFLASLVKKSSITFAKSLKSNDILADIKNTKVTMMNGVPLLFENILKGILTAVNKQKPAKQFLFHSMYSFSKVVNKLLNANPGTALFKGLREKAGLSTIRFFVSGGAALPPEIEKGFQALGITIYQGYGLTETSPVVSVNTPLHRKIGSIGKAINCNEVKIDNPDENGVGELLVKGSNVMPEYYNNPERTAEVLKSGWLYTGDLAHIDEEGYIYIDGRKKNVIVTKAGKNVFPEEVEYYINISPFILESVVYGFFNEKTEREEIHAIVVPNYKQLDTYAEEKKLKLEYKDIEDILKKEIYKQTKELPVYKRIREFRIREEEFPKTSTKKIKRHLLELKPVKINNK